MHYVFPANKNQDKIITKNSTHFYHKLLGKRFNIYTHWRKWVVNSIHINIHIR